MRLTKIVCCLAYVAVLNTANAFDLDGAYQAALEYNADYLASIAKNKSGQETEKQGRSALLPQISAAGSFGENYLSTTGASLYYNQPTFSAQLQQVIFDFSKFSTYSKSKFSTRVANLQLDQARQKLIVDVAQAYFDVLYAKDTLNAIRITKNSFQQQFNKATKSFAAGTVTVADINDAKSSYDSAVADEIKAENDLLNRKNILQNLTGLDPELIQPVVTNINLVNPNPNTVDAWSSLAKTGNLNIKIAETQMQMAKQDVNIAIAGHLPSVYASGSYQNQGNFNVDSSDPSQNNPLIATGANFPGSFPSTYQIASAAVTLNLPIYSGGAVSSQVRQAKSNYIASEQQLVSTMRKTDQDTRNAFWTVQNGVDIVKAQTQALKSAALKLKSDKMGYEVGVRNSIDLVTSEKNYYTAIQNYNQSRYQYLLSRLQLEYLTGKIDPKFLTIINANIKPDIGTKQNTYNTSTKAATL